MRIGIIVYGNLGKALVRGLILTGFSQKDIDINRGYCYYVIKEEYRSNLPTIDRHRNKYYEKGRAKL